MCVATIDRQSCECTLPTRVEREGDWIFPWPEWGLSVDHRPISRKFVVREQHRCDEERIRRSLDSNRSVCKTWRQMRIAWEDPSTIDVRSDKDCRVFDRREMLEHDEVERVFPIEITIPRSFDHDCRSCQRDRKGNGRVTILQKNKSDLRLWDECRLLTANQSVDAEFIDEFMIDRFTVGKQFAENVEIRIDFSGVVHQILNRKRDVKPSGPERARETHLSDVQRCRMTIVQSGAMKRRRNQSSVLFHIRPEMRGIGFATAKIQFDDVRPLIQFSSKINIRSVNILGEVSQRIVVHHPTIVCHDTFEKRLLVVSERFFDLLGTCLEDFLVWIGEVVADERRARRYCRMTRTERIEEVKTTSTDAVVDGQLKIEFD